MSKKKKKKTKKKKKRKKKKLQSFAWIDPDSRSLEWVICIMPFEAEIFIVR
jgi:hypothetical protein